MFVGDVEEQAMRGVLFDDVAVEVEDSNGFGRPGNDVGVKTETIFTELALDSDAGQAGGEIDEFQMARSGSTGFERVERKGGNNSTVGIANRSGPAGFKIEVPRQSAKFRGPAFIGFDIFANDLLLLISG